MKLSEISDFRVKFLEDKETGKAVENFSNYIVQYVLKNVENITEDETEVLSDYLFEVLNVDITMKMWGIIVKHFYVPEKEINNDPIDCPLYGEVYSCGECDACGYEPLLKC